MADKPFRMKECAVISNMYITLKNVSVTVQGQHDICRVAQTFMTSDTFSFSIVNFSHMESNIPSKPAYGVVISKSVDDTCMF